MAAYKQEFPETEQEGFFHFKRKKFLNSSFSRCKQGCWFGETGGEGGGGEKGEEIMQIMEGGKNHPTRYEFHQYSSA